MEVGDEGLHVERFLRVVYENRLKLGKFIIVQILSPKDVAPRSFEHVYFPIYYSLILLRSFHSTHVNQGFLNPFPSQILKDKEEGLQPLALGPFGFEQEVLGVQCPHWLLSTQIGKGLFNYWMASLVDDSLQEKQGDFHLFDSFGLQIDFRKGKLQIFLVTFLTEILQKLDQI